MITMKLDEHSAEDFKAIQTLRECGFSDEEIQMMYDRQKEIDKKGGKEE